MIRRFEYDIDSENRDKAHSVKCGKSARVRKSFGKFSVAYAIQLSSGEAFKD